VSREEVVQLGVLQTAVFGRESVVTTLECDGNDTLGDAFIDDLAAAVESISLSTKNEDDEINAAAAADTLTPAPASVPRRAALTDLRLANTGVGCATDGIARLMGAVRLTRIDLSSNRIETVEHIAIGLKKCPTLMTLE
jgi:hypothetical protein